MTEGKPDFRRGVVELPERGEWGGAAAAEPAGFGWLQGALIFCRFRSC
jgi:hypothetical protein